MYKNKTKRVFVLFCSVFLTVVLQFNEWLSHKIAVCVMLRELCAIVIAVYSLSLSLSASTSLSVSLTLLLSFLISLGTRMRVFV